jgi:hypothetical protein
MLRMNYYKETFLKPHHLRQSADVTFSKWLITNKVICQPEPVEGGA